MVTVFAAEVVVFPAASVATAVSLCVPAVVPWVFQLNEYGLAVSVARFLVPSRKKVTLVRPDAAAEPVPPSAAVAVTVTLVPRVKLDPAEGAVMETVGAAASTRICCDLVASRLPAASAE